MKNFKLFTFLLVIVIFSASAFAVDLNYDQNDFQPTFNDIDRNHPQFTEIEYLAHRKIFQGHSDGTFRDVKINRAELMMLMIRLLGIEPDPEVYKDCFPDVDGWAEAAICYAAEQDWVHGYPEDGKFHPDWPVNNAESRKIILNPLFKEQIDAQDVEDPRWFLPYYLFANNINLTSSPLYKADQPSLRSEVAEMIFDALLVKENEWDAYHPYLKDLILKEEGLGHLITNPVSCYDFDSFEFDFYSNYLELEYGIAEFETQDIDDFYRDNSDQEYFALSGKGSFCPLLDGGFMFGSWFFDEQLTIYQIVTRFDQEGELVSNKESSCSIIEVEFGYDSTDIFPDTIDVETFEPLSCFYSKDANHIYFDVHPLKEADLSTFETLTFPYAKDANHVYEFDNIFEEADVDTFEPLLTGNLPFNIALYSKDANNVYFVDDGIVEYADPETFEAVPMPASITPKSLEELDDWLYDFEDLIFGKDDRHVFVWDDIMIELEPEHFRILSSDYVADANHVYNYSSPMQLQELDSKTAEIVKQEDGSFYFKDANNYACMFFGDGGETFYCGYMSLKNGIEWISYHNSDQHLAFDWPREWGPVEEGDWGIMFYGSPQSILSTGSDEMMNRQIFIGLNNPTIEYPGMGGYWGFEGRSLTSQDVVDNYCDGKENCEIIENSNGIRMAKHDSSVTDYNTNPGEEATAYYLFNPKSQESGIVISPIRIKNRAEIKNFDELFEVFVDSIEFVD